MNPASTALSLNPNAKLLGLLQRMETGSFSTDWSGCVNDLGRIVCESTSSNTYDSKLTDEFMAADNDDNAAVDYACGVIAGWHLGHDGEHRKALSRQWRGFAKLKPPWK